jgi:hypothetical protein
LAFFALACTGVLLSCCSAIVQRLRSPDVNGCGDIKWGMTLGQVRTLLGSRARIETDLQSGTKLEYVRMMIAGVEREGFLGTDAGTDHVNGAHFVINGAASDNTFHLLKQDVVNTYGAPSIEHMLTAGPICFWHFASGTITLTLHPKHDDFKGGGVLLAYIKNPLISTQN